MVRKFLLITIMLVVLTPMFFAAGNTGYLSVRAADGVEILVNGKPFGVVKDGQLFLELAAGTYDVTAQGYGFTSETIRNVKIEPLKATTLEISLKAYKVISEKLSGKLQIDLIRKYGTVRIFSIPFNGARVTINGEAYGETDIELTFFPMGQLSIEVGAPNKSKVTGVFFLEENSTLMLLADFIDKKIYQIEASCDSPAGMVLVAKGSFTMGDTWGDGASDEKPTHKVTFTYDFYMGKYEVTFDEYDAFCEATGRSKPKDEGWGRGSRPVINVTWWDAIDYCNWLSEKEGLPKAYDDNGNLLDKDGRITTDPSKVVGYRLPTEAESEYAARGGNKSRGYQYAGSSTIRDVAWYDSNSGNKTQEVGKKAPNELGIYDMSGNVWEWCSDWYGNYSSLAQTNPYSNSGSYRVGRGSSWNCDAESVQVANRGRDSPTFTGLHLGFRIAKTMP